MALQLTKALLMAGVALWLPLLLGWEKPNTAGETGKPISATGLGAKQPRNEPKASTTTATDQIARDVLASFEADDPGWKVRMEALVNLARAGAAAVPILVDALAHGSPSKREFAAQALAVIADPGSRSALEQALNDSQLGVRAYAVKALSMSGQLERTEARRQLAKKDAPYFMRAYIDLVFECDEPPAPEAIREALINYDLSSMDTARRGQVAPDFCLPDADGTIYRLSQFRGEKTVILEFQSEKG